MKVLKEISMAIVFALVIILLLGIFYSPEPQIQILNRDIVHRDTVTVVEQLPPKRVYIEKQVIVRDTVYITNSGNEIATEVARLDTTFGRGEELSVAYFTVPSVFELEFVGARDSIKTITITKEINTYVDSSAWWDNFKWGATSGIVATALLTFLVK
jgi:hypothetical protein